MGLLFLTIGAILGCTGLASGQSSKPDPNPEKVRADLQRILADPQFRPIASGDNWGDRLLKWVGDQWDKLLHWLRNLFTFPTIRMQVGGKAGAYLSIFFAAVFIALALALIAWLIARLIRYIRTSRRKKTIADSASYDLDEEEAPLFITEPDIWIQEATKYASSGDYRRAFRAVFIAALLHLSQEGRIEFGRSRTNGDYLGELRFRGYDSEYEILMPLTLDFDKLWYGDKSCQEIDYVTGFKHYQELKRLSSAAKRPALTPVRQIAGVVS